MLMFPLRKSNKLQDLIYKNRIYKQKNNCLLIQYNYKVLLKNIDNVIQSCNFSLKKSQIIPIRHEYILKQLSLQKNICILNTFSAFYIV